MSEELNKISKTDEEWRKELTAEEFLVTRQAGTERPFSGVYWNETREGVYSCKCCKQPLFASNTKFDAGCGWPSFFEIASKLLNAAMTSGLSAYGAAAWNVLTPWSPIGFP